VKKNHLLTLPLTVILAGLLLIGPAMAPPVVNTNPRLKTAPVGGTFQVDINVTGVLNLYGWEINMTFDKTVLDVIDVVEGPFLLDFADLVGVGTWPLGPIVDNTNGWVNVGSALFPNPDPPDGADGNGVLATITFQVMKYGFTRMHFAISKLNSYDPGSGLPVAITHTTTDGAFDNRLVGDCDSDRDVDYSDFVILAGAYGSILGQPAYKEQADFDHDGDIDYSNFVGLAGNYGKTLPP
jgi:hypothetical protein